MQLWNLFPATLVTYIIISICISKSNFCWEKFLFHITLTSVKNVYRMGLRKYDNHTLQIFISSESLIVKDSITSWVLTGLSWPLDISTILCEEESTLMEGPGTTVLVTREWYSEAGERCEVGLHRKEKADLWQGWLELVWHRTIYKEVGGEVEHHQQVGHGLQAHHPEGWDVVVHMLDTGYLHIWKISLFISFIK